MAGRDRLDSGLSRKVELAERVELAFKGTGEGGEELTAGKYFAQDGPDCTRTNKFI